MTKSESEIWRSLQELPGVEVSTFGKVRTLDKVTSSEKYTRFTKGHVLKQCDNGHGYLQVGIQIDKKRTMKYVHRLVAQAFIQNPDSLPEINHKDCNRSNNDVSNLEWVTHEENNQYRDKYGMSYKEYAKKNPVYAVNLDTLEVYRFESQIEASRELVVNQGNINNVIKGKQKQTGGYWFTSADSNTYDLTSHKH